MLTIFRRVARLTGESDKENAEKVTEGALCSIFEKGRLKLEVSLMTMNDKDKQHERINYWLSLAQYDLDTAEAMLKTERLLYVGFMCHQVIEKMLKACYVKHCAGPPPYSHNLGYLGRESGIYALLSEDQKTFLDRLEPLNIESRYPDYKKRVMAGLTFEKSEELFRQAKELYTWLQTQL